MIGKKLSQRVHDREVLRGRRFSSEADLTGALLELPADSYHVVVIHEDGRSCSRFECHCSPTYVLRELTRDTYDEGEDLEAEWMKGHAS